MNLTTIIRFNKQSKKGFRFLLSVCLLFHFSRSEALNAPGNSEDSLLANAKGLIEMKGQIKFLKGTQNDKGVLDSAIITVYNEANIVVASYNSDKKGKTSFKLPLNRRFTIQISKQGFVPKIVEVNTVVPVNRTNNYTFAFDLEIFEKITGLDVTVLKKPIAKVFFNTISNAFNYDYNYTGKINYELQRTYQEYYELQRDLQDAAEYKERIHKKKK
jgi:hypothetical protein